MEDLSRMCRLFSVIPQGLEPVANILKQVRVIGTGAISIRIEFFVMVVVSHRSMLLLKLLLWLKNH